MSIDMYTEESSVSSIWNLSLIGLIWFRDSIFSILIFAYDGLR